MRGSERRSASLAAALHAWECLAPLPKCGRIRAPVGALWIPESIPLAGRQGFRSRVGDIRTSRSATTPAVASSERTSRATQERCDTHRRDRTVLGGSRRGRCAQNSPRIAIVRYGNVRICEPLRSELRSVIGPSSPHLSKRNAENSKGFDVKRWRVECALHRCAGDGRVGARARRLWMCGLKRLYIGRKSKKRFLVSADRPRTCPDYSHISA